MKRILLPLFCLMFSNICNANPNILIDKLKAKKPDLNIERVHQTPIKGIFGLELENLNIIFCWGLIYYR